jgi:hypothetical protein
MASIFKSKQRLFLVMYSDHADSMLISSLFYSLPNRFAGKHQGHSKYGKEPWKVREGNTDTGGA